MSSDCRILGFLGLLGLSLLPGTQARAADLEWVDLATGLAAARQAERPVVVWYAGDEDRDWFGEFADRSALRRALRPFVLVRVDAEALRGDWPEIPAPAGAPPPHPADPRVVADVLRFVEGPAQLAVLRSSERVARHWDERTELPSLGDLRRVLARVARREAARRRQAEEVERAIAESRAAEARKDPRAAVLAILPWDDSKVRVELEEELAEAIHAVIREHRSAAQKRFEAADQLVSDARATPPDRVRLLTEALDAYLRIAREAPFPDVVKRAQREAVRVRGYLQPGGAP